MTTAGDVPPGHVRPRAEVMAVAAKIVHHPRQRGPRAAYEQASLKVPTAESRIGVEDGDGMIRPGCRRHVVDGVWVDGMVSAGLERMDREDMVYKHEQPVEGIAAGVGTELSHLGHAKLHLRGDPGRALGMDRLYPQGIPAGV